MTFDWWTFGLQTVNAVVLIWLLARFLFRPVSQIIADRQAQAHAALDEAEAAKTAADRVLTEVHSKQDAIAKERAALVRAAEAEATERKKQIIEAARAEAEEMHSEAEAERLRLRELEAERWRSEAGALAADIAGRLLKRLPGGARALDFSDGLIEAVGALPKSTRDTIGSDGPLTLRAASDLSDAERAIISEGLAKRLGHTVELRFEADESLIAGLELQTPHAIVRNNFRADLEHIAKRISADERA